MDELWSTTGQPEIIISCVDSRKARHLMLLLDRLPSFGTLQACSEATAEKDEHGILLPREVGGLDVRVSEGMLDRALQVMSQALGVLERQGFSVEVSEGHTVAVINGKRVSFRIEEPIQRVVTKKARVQDPTDRWDYDEVVTHEPAGKLALVIQANMWGQYEPRTSWSDGKVRRVESLVGDFVAGLMRADVVIQRQEDEQKHREAERDRRVREAEQLRKAIQEEEKKLEQFSQWVESWEQAEKLRRFITIYAEKSRSWPAEKQEKYKAWIEWATKQAGRLDPFFSKKPNPYWIESTSCGVSETSLLAQYSDTAELNVDPLCCIRFFLEMI